MHGAAITTSCGGETATSSAPTSRLGVHSGRQIAAAALAKRSDVPRKRIKPDHGGVIDCRGSHNGPLESGPQKENGGHSGSRSAKSGTSRKAFPARFFSVPFLFEMAARCLIGSSLVRDDRKQ